MPISQLSLGRNLAVLLLAGLAAGACEQGQVALNPPDKPVPAPAIPVTNADIWRSKMVETTLSFDGPNGQEKYPAMFEKLTIEGFHSVDALDFPFPGLLVIHLRAGEMTTAIDGDREERETGDIWTVLPGVQMGVATEDDKVILAAYLIGEKFLEVEPGREIPLGAVEGREKYAEVASNLFSREAFAIGDPEKPFARLIDFNVGPKLQADPYKFDGAAILQITSGSGPISVNGKEVATKLGTSVPLNQGDELVINNSRAERPLKFRAMVWYK